jgi:hypothetical protein
MCKRTGALPTHAENEDLKSSIDTRPYFNAYGASAHRRNQLGLRA